MCYTGGPYCYKDAKRKLESAATAFKEDPSHENRRKFQDAREQYKMTPEYINNLRETEPEKAVVLQARYDKMKESALTYLKIHEDNKKSIGRVQGLVEKNYQDSKRHNQAYYALSNEMKKLQKSGSEDAQTAEKIKNLEESAAGAKQAEENCQKRGAALNQQITTLNDNTKQNAVLHRTGRPPNYNHMMPEKFKDYFAATHEKHFGYDSPGSTFTETKGLTETLALAQKQRGTLLGDDREKLIKEHGADPSSFTDDKRYIMVKTAGKLGSVGVDKLPPETMLTVHQKDPKSQPVCVAEVDSKPDTNVGTIVLVDDPKIPGTTGNPTLLITAFPGVSGARGSNPDLEPYVGQQITIEQARKLYGGRDFSVNTILKK